MKISNEHIFHCVSSLQQHRPLVLNITNYVAMNTCANVLLAIGASPLMAHDKAELEELIDISQSLVLNIGTLDKQLIESILFAQHHELIGVRINRGQVIGVKS